MNNYIIQDPTTTASLFARYKVERPKKPSVSSQRAELVQRFHLRINKEREGSKYKPLSAKAVGVLLGHIPTEDLHAFMRMCEKGDVFSKVFFGAIKPKKK